MKRTDRNFIVNGTSALEVKPSRNVTSARLISFPGNIQPANRSYGVEHIRTSQPAYSAAPERGSITGRPLNMFSKAETIAAFAFCTILSFAVIFCM